MLEVKRINFSNEHTQKERESNEKQFARTTTRP
jgi:hypothetical protein